MFPKEFEMFFYLEKKKLINTKNRFKKSSPSLLFILKHFFADIGWLVLPLQQIEDGLFGALLDILVEVREYAVRSRYAIEYSIGFDGVTMILFT